MANPKATYVVRNGVRTLVTPGEAAKKKAAEAAYRQTPEYQVAQELRRMKLMRTEQDMARVHRLLDYLLDPKSPL